MEDTIETTDEDRNYAAIAGAIALVGFAAYGVGTAGRKVYRLCKDRVNVRIPKRRDKKVLDVTNNK